MDAHAWNDADTLTRRGVDFIRQRKFDAALDELEQAAAIDPFNPVILFHMGVAFDELDRLDEAVEVYQRAIEVGGDEAETLNRLAIDLHQTGHSRESVEMFERIEKLDPSYEAAYCNRIHVLVEMNEHEQAEEVFYLGRLQRDHCPQCYFNIGVSLASRGLFRKAISCFGRAMDLPGSAGHVHRRLADCLLAEGRLDGARQHYIKALGHDGSDVASLISLADVLMQLRRFNEAEQRLNAGLRLAPDHPQVQLLWGRLMYERGDDGASGMALRRAIQLDPTVLKAHLTLSRIAVRSAQY
ncbi:MAG TPA: tetratricopeptide repeat protein, partial [Tepidisphaeraceae bacterium]|nr:tetratricopeptide repeat protein [Tepidisphaeraceae bacterium]